MHIMSNFMYKKILWSSVSEIKSLLKVAKYLKDIFFAYLYWIILIMLHLTIEIQDAYFFTIVLFKP